jgi:CRISPR-associated endonuclease/helicase Cas3
MISTTHPYDDFFKLAFGSSRSPFAYQLRIATDAEMPALINAPTGAGKTAAILGAWLWRRLENPQSVGRRLVYCLPMRTLVDQTAKVARMAIRNLATEYEEVDKKKIEVHVLMGGEVAVDWDALPEREAIIIGTQDMLLSRSLNRGYALNTARYPLPFGLLNNDCLFLFDEIQLMGDALATSAQLAAFRQTLGSFGVQQSVWMSATLDKKWLKTVDFKEQAEKLEELKLTADDRAIPALNKRLHAIKRIQPAPSSCRIPDGLVGFIKERHTRGTQTLVVVNRVARAREVFAALENEYGVRVGKRKKKNATQEVSAQDASVSNAASVPQLELIHSRFRPADRKRWTQIFDGALDTEGAGRIIVATQVVEAGLDISSRLLITDIAPYSSLVQRFGRCNRRGEDEEAHVYWIDRPLLGKEEKFAGKETLDDKERTQIARPYALEQVDKARELVARLTSAAPADLPVYSDEVNYEYVLRRRDIVDLFDTTTDLSGYDLDISRFVRGGDERDVYVAWREFKEGEPNALTPRPAQRELCPVSIGELKLFLDKLKDKQPPMAWRWNPLLGIKPLSPKQRERPDAAEREHGWEKVSAEELRPGMTVLMDSRTGGYTTKRGWDNDSIEDVPEVNLDEVEQQPPQDMGGDAYSEDAGNAIVLTHEEVEKRKSKEERPPRYAQTLRAHSTEARQKMTEILDALGDPQLEPYREDLLVAVLHHDWGKAHEVFQDTMRRGLQGVLDESLYPNEPLAKTIKKNIKHRRKHFRHELASALALLQQKESDLCIYLAASHHGKVRLSIRALPNEARPSGEQTEHEGRKYARGIWDKDELPAVRLSDDVEREAVTLDLEPMLLGSADGATSWLERMTRLRDTVGVFRLAYLECLIRAADMQASAHPVNCISVEDSTDTRTENNA